MQNWDSLHALYIHWPFCPYRCSFCPFVALAQHEQFMERYHYAVVKEVEQFGHLLSSETSIRTIFVGGGTPSTWPDHLLLDMFDKLKDVFSFAEVHEVTIEVNPGTVRAEQLALWKQIGINRLSIGVQTFDDSVLHRLNRHQAKSDVYFLLDRAAPLFDNISVDLIVGLPGVEKEAWRTMLQEVVRWPITHISIYCLMVHETTKLYFEYKKGTVFIPDDDEVADLYEWSVDFLEQYGFAQYELSNFALPGYESKHNHFYWERKKYKGFGLGACSFDGNIRLQNQKNLMLYIEAVERGQKVTIFEERLTRNQAQLEIIMLGLRTTKGVTYAHLMEDLSPKEKIDRAKNIEWLKQHHFMHEQEDRLFLTPKGMVVENEIVVKFFFGQIEATEDLV